MPRRIIRHIRRMLGDRSLSPESRLVAAILYLTGAHHLHCNIYAFCGALRAVAHLYPGIGIYEIRFQQEGWYSSKVDRALAEMQKAGFVRWNLRKDQLTILRDGPARCRFVGEVHKLPGLVTCRGSIGNAADQLCYFLDAR